MDTRKPKQKSDLSQGDKFIETARRLGADEDEAAFVEKLKRIAQAKPKQDEKKG